MKNCPCCEIKERYTFDFIDAETLQDIQFLVDRLFEEAQQFGYLAAIQDDIKNKIDFLDSIEEDDCDCGLF